MEPQTQAQDSLHRLTPTLCGRLITGDRLAFGLLKIFKNKIHFGPYL
jgi:hypothetical protein